MKGIEWILQKLKLSFNERTSYDRAPEQTFDYRNTMKNKSPKEIFQKKVSGTCELGTSGEDENRMELGFSSSASEAKPRTAGNRKFVFLYIENQLGTTAEEAATGERTQSAQEKKLELWNGYLILNL